MENTDIWKALCETDPNRTKRITGKKYQGDSINPNYIYEKLTKQFGPCGIGWGFVITKEGFNTGNNGDIVHSVEIGLWYLMDGKKSEPILGKGATTFSGEYSSGTYTDEDAEKKSVTDAITKASQLIGMSADIFGGQWGDSKYIAELKEKYGDNGDTTHKPSTTAQKSNNGGKTATTAQVKLLAFKFKNAGFSDAQRREWLSKNYNVKSLNDLPMSEVNGIIKTEEGGMLSPLDLQEDIPL